MSPQDKKLKSLLEHWASTSHLGPNLVYRYGWDFVVQHGKFYEIGKFPRQIKKGAPKQCFGNAILLSAKYGYKYIEGYALHSVIPIPIQHAWNSYTPMRIAFVRTPAKHILSHVAIGAKHGDIFAFRFPDKSPVEVCCCVASEAELPTMSGSVFLGVMDRQEFERAIPATKTLISVPFKDFSSSFSPNSSFALSCDSTGLFGIKLSPSSLFVPCFSSAWRAAAKAIHGWSGTTVAFYHDKDYIIKGNLPIAKEVLIDNTWLNTGVAYMGVEFSMERADDATWNGDCSILNDYYRRYPLYQKKWTGEDYSIQWPESERLKLLRGKEFEKLQDLMERELLDDAQRISE